MWIKGLEVQFLTNQKQGPALCRNILITNNTKTLSTDDDSLSSFWKGTLPPYREIIDDNSIASPGIFHSIEDNGERDDCQSTQDGMILSDSIVKLSIK
jgi:hypothetical protein